MTNMDALGLTSDSVLPHVRTDIIDYLKESRNFSITRLQLNYYNQISKSLFYKLSGYLSQCSTVGGVKCYIDRTLKAMVLVWSYGKFTKENTIKCLEHEIMIL